MKKFSFFILAMLVIAGLMTSCSNEDDMYERIDKAFSNLRFNAQEVGSEKSFANWNEWAIRYMWDFKGIIEVKYDTTTDEYYVDGKQLAKYGFFVNLEKYKLYDSYDLGFDFPKTGESFLIYVAGDVINDLFRVFDYFVWNDDDSFFPVTKQQGRNSAGEFLDWKTAGISEEEYLGGMFAVAHSFEGEQEWCKTYQDIYHQLLTVKYCAAIDAFVAFPTYGAYRGGIMFILRNYYPKNKKDNSLFDIYAAGRLIDCDKRLHEQDARLYKYLDVVDSFPWEERDTYHKPKGL